MRTSDDHYAKGFTARKGESFQGRHRPKMLFIFDEANGIDPIYWAATRSMFDPSLGHAWLAIYNPTNTTSQAYVEANSAAADGTPRWHTFRLSAANHPNLLAELDGLPPPVPHAVSLRMFEEWIQNWCEPVQAGDEKATDFCWPPLDWCQKHGRTPRWYRPGPIFQGRALGLDPDAGDGVWSPSLFEACLRGPCPAFPLNQLPQIGADMATGKGDDYYALHCRWGAVSVRHETSNTMDPARITARIKDAAAEMAALVNQHRPHGAAQAKPTDIPIKLDDDGTGNAVAAFLRSSGYRVHAIGAGTRANRDDLYPRKRDELWFETAEKAKSGMIHLGRLDAETLRRLKQQLLAPTWELDATGRRAVEKKEKTKEKIGRSPDDADALALCHHQMPDGGYQAIDPLAGQDRDQRSGEGWWGQTGGRGGHFFDRR